MNYSTPKSVTFLCHAPLAHTVFIAGTFNGWDADSIPMYRSSITGDWTVLLLLPPGPHEFKFVVDGHWCCESDLEHEAGYRSIFVVNDFGSKNHLLEVL